MHTLGKAKQGADDITVHEAEEGRVVKVRKVKGEEAGVLQKKMHLFSPHTHTHTLTMHGDTHTRMQTGRRTQEQMHPHHRVHTPTAAEITEWIPAA